MTGPANRRMKLKSEICNSFLIALGKDILLFSSGSDICCAPSHLQKWTNSQFLVPLFWKCVLHSSPLCGYQAKQHLAKQRTLTFPLQGMQRYWQCTGGLVHVRGACCPEEQSRTVQPIPDLGNLGKRSQMNRNFA